MHRPFALLPLAFALSLYGLSMIACGSSVPPSTQTMAAQSTIAASPGAGAVIDTSIPSVSAPTPADTKTGPVFKIAVIVDTSSEPVTREQSKGVFNEANGLLQEFVPVSLEMVDFVEDGSGGATKDMAARYLASHPAAPVNGILIFSFGDGGQAKLQDGYGYALPGPAGFRNTFVSPAVGADQIYTAVVRFGLKYMACGYGGSDTLQSTAAIDGECRNRPGTVCVQNNGYSMCADAVRNLYASTPTHFVSSTIIHELLHLFSPGGDKDNYATPECNARMGYPDGFFDLQESQYYNGICPFVYDDFLASYQP
jgi:hypothetical protein